MVHGRADNMFISGGENIHPEEIEARLLELHGVRQAVVVAIPDAEYGARPIAFIDADERDGMDEDFLRAELQTNLAKFKIPDRFLSWPRELSQSGVKPHRRDFDEKNNRGHRAVSPATPNSRSGTRLPFHSLSAKAINSSSNDRPGVCHAARLSATDASSCGAPYRVSNCRPTDS